MIFCCEAQFSNRKVKTLTDVVESLQKQKEVYQQILKFEIRSRITQSKPLFSTFKISGTLPFCQLQLKNRGQKSRNVTVSEFNNVHTITIISPPSIITNENFVLSFFIKEPNLKWSFDLVYETGFGETFKQTVTGLKTKYDVLWPVEA